MQDEIFVPDERMARYGENCARAALASGIGGLSEVRRLLRNSLRLCTHTAAVLTKFAAEQAVGMHVPEEFLRFSDNAYTAEKDGKQLLRQLRGYRSIPIGRDGQPIVFVIAEALLKTGAETLTPERLRRFLEGVQRERAWTETECALFLPMLCTAAVLRIAAVATHIERVCRAYAAKRRDDPFGAERIVAEAHLRGAEEPSLAAYTDAAERLHREADASLRGALRVLRVVENAAYARAVRAVSRTEQCLNADPTGIYPQMDERSQSYYRALLVRAAKLRKTTEFDLAEEYLREAQREKRHIGHWVTGEVRLLTRQRRW
ncbi:MAG: hypothetical protein IKU55_05115, partial [Clostridia bacterium]|nr:hypothetical protein [Clostridia bacterium]